MTLTQNQSNPGTRRVHLLERLADARDNKDAGRLRHEGDGALIGEAQEEKEIHRFRQPKAAIDVRNRRRKQASDKGERVRRWNGISPRGGAPRLAEVRRGGLPAFCIFNDRTLRALAASHPETTQDLPGVSGIGISSLAKKGKDMCRVLRENGG
jgi:superfamily II DNA helicase RecQ